MDKEQNEIIDEIENMNIIRHELEIEEENTHNRFKSIDDKLNMLLVFNAGLLLLISYIIPITTASLPLIILKWIVFALFIGLNLTSIIFILLGMSLKFSSAIDVSNFEDLYKTKKDVLLHSFIHEKISTIQTKRKSIEIKMNRFTIAMILNIINVCICVLGIILNLI